MSGIPLPALPCRLFTILLAWALALPAATAPQQPAADEVVEAESRTEPAPDHGWQRLHSRHFRDPLLTAQVTVRDLLTHRTGLPSTDFWTFYQEMDLAEQIERLDPAPPRTR